MPLSHGVFCLSATGQVRGQNNFLIKTLTLLLAQFRTRKWPLQCQWERQPLLALLTGLQAHLLSSIHS